MYTNHLRALSAANLIVNVNFYDISKKLKSLKLHFFDENIDLLKRIADNISKNVIH